MKIGMINFDRNVAGLNQFFEKVITMAESDHLVQKIKIKENETELEFTDIHTEEPGTAPFLNNKLVPASPLVSKTEVYKPLEQFDAIVMAGPEPVRALAEALEKELTETKFLYIPASLANAATGPDVSMGYDTAINYVIESVLKIQDTIDSLKYPNLRLFGIQLTGEVPGLMLEEAAAALGGYPIFENWTDFEPASFQAALKETAATGQTYYFVLFNETVNPDEIPETLDAEIKVDWKWGQIDEAFYGGPYPSALDRIIAMQFASETWKWIGNEQSSGELVFKNRTAGFRAL